MEGPSEKERLEELEFIEMSRREGIRKVQDLLSRMSAGTLGYDGFFACISAKGIQGLFEEQYITSGIEGKIVQLLGKGIYDVPERTTDGYTVCHYVERYSVDNDISPEWREKLSHEEKKLDELSDKDDMGTLKFEFRGHHYEFEASKRVAEHLKLGQEFIRFEFETDREVARRELEGIKQASDRARFYRPRSLFGNGLEPDLQEKVTAFASGTPSELARKKEILKRKLEEKDKLEEGVREVVPAPDFTKEPDEHGKDD